MRSREEQIDAMTDDLDMFHANNPGGGMRGYARLTSAQEIAAKHIDEAERRAEQRVRAEIARDSERLDWLEDIVDTGFRVSPIGRGISGASFNHGYGGISAATLRSAIDAAREAQG